MEKEVRVLITRDFPEVGIEMLKKTGFHVTEWPHDRPMTPEELIENCQEHQALFCASSDKLDEDFLRSSSHLEIISQFSAGYDNIDVEVANELKIPIGNAPGAMKNAAADVAFGLMINASRKMFYMHRKLINGDWSYFRPQANLGQELNGKTLGVFGLGQIGFEMARKCKGAYDMEIIYCNTSSNKKAEDELDAKKVDFKELLESSDVLTVHCSLNPNTQGLFNSAAFKKMKPASIFVNTSRGPVHNEEDLIEALQNGEIWGAGLDVTNPEPMSKDNPLLQMETVAVLPHIGSSTVEARNRMSEYAAQNIIDFYTKGTIPHLVNPEAMK